MQLIKGLTLLLFCENILGIFRNITSRSNINVLKCIYAAFLVCILVAGNTTFQVLSSTCASARIHSFLTTLGSILTIIWGCSKSNAFAKLITYLKLTHEFLKRHKEYVSRLEQLTSVIVILVMFFTVANFTVSIYIYNTRFGYLNINNVYVYYFLNIVLLSSLLRCAGLYMMYYTILTIVAEQLEFVRLESKIHVSNLLGSKANDTESHRYIKLYHRDDVEPKSCTEWFAPYTHICECGELINIIFSFPVNFVCIVFHLTT